MKRQIIRIDEEKCTGCGDCVPSCEEGAIQIIDGKAKLVTDSLCDGLGACLGHCPEGALIIEEREADEFVDPHLEKKAEVQGDSKSPLPCGCPGSMMQDFRKEASDSASQEAPARAVPSQLQQWPVQLRLLNPSAPFFKNADLVVSADCVPFTYANFHQRFLKDKALVIFCPKLDEDVEEYIRKLTDIIKYNDTPSITMVRMEVPCCGGTVAFVEEAVKRSGKHVLLKEFTISLRGEII